MNKFKAGDKVTVKENFWEIESGVYVYSGMKKLVGRILEVQSISSSGNFYTKQDDSNDNTSWAWDKNWLELYNPIITWSNIVSGNPVVSQGSIEAAELLTTSDVLNNFGGKRMVSLVANDLVFISKRNDFNVTETFYHKQELQNDGFTIKQATPVEEPKETIIVGGRTYKLVK